MARRHSATTGRLALGPSWNLWTASFERCSLVRMSNAAGDTRLDTSAEHREHLSKDLTEKERELCAEAMVLLSTFHRSLKKGKEDPTPKFDFTDAALPVARIVEKLGISAEFGKACAHLPHNLVIGVDSEK